MTAAPRPKLLYVATEDWFFCSHFLPMARAARDAGYEVVVACRVRQHGEAISREGFRLAPVEAERRERGPAGVWRYVQLLAALMRREKPAIVHLVAMQPVILGGIAARLAGVRRRVCAITGLGPVGGSPSPKWRAARAAIRLLLRGPVGGRGAIVVFENADDPPLLGLDPRDPDQVAVVNGAGIDPAAYPAALLPPAPPLRLAMVARMLWTKGVDVAVEAVRIAREHGADVELSLYGAPDPSNATTIDEATLRAWSARPGIAWHGPTRDVAGVWRDHHAAVLPSHGEGMPRMLIEAACCGRALLATDVSGCRSLVRDGQNGFLFPLGDAAALAEQIVQLAADPALLARLGAAARATVLNGYTEADVSAAMLAVYHRLLGRDP
ncbi:glycosyl transferase family 1 [Alsobacter metallidurans]|uniref:Glycosyl transferase family 1 n=1 Tax=Alsobacter metallidurans TaxID=340221 RepID=A0A917ICB4_9HYPH|nr:glycosyltransferase family 4 protein [Alsobacter metallidurans]GGH32378.1 glycosyl transferase family 1 [Alsobacter metallidurans]